MKRFAAAFLTLAFLLGLSTPASAAKAKAAIMRLLSTEGTVFICDAGGRSVEYQKNMRLYSGYTVSTGSGSSAYILLDDTKAVRLDRNTTVNIKKSGRKLQVKLKCGQLAFNVTAPLESNETLEIRTSSMVVGVRGSSGIVSTTQVIFGTGHGFVYSGGRRYALAAGLGYRPEWGVFPADASMLPSVYLKEVRDDGDLQAELRSERAYNPEGLIALIPEAEAREEAEYRNALGSVTEPPAGTSVDPAFGKSGEPAPISYTVTWRDGDRVLKTEILEEGALPSWTGAAPVREADARYTYSFTGWSPELAPVTGDAAYTAVFSNALRQYTVTWKNDDGSVIDTSSVPYGETPRHDAPSKAADAQYTYSFTGWSPELAPVTGDTVYTAVFSGAPRQYTVTWKNDDGSVIDTSSVPYGETPKHDAPSKAAGTTAFYEFAGWDRDPVPVTGDAVYTAVFNAIYDFNAIIPDGHDLYWVYYPMEGNTPITTAREGESFTFYLGTADGETEIEVRLNGAALGEENLWYSEEMDAFVCTFLVPKDPAIEISAFNPDNIK